MPEELPPTSEPISPPPSEAAATESLAATAEPEYAGEQWTQDDLSTFSDESEPAVGLEQIADDEELADDSATISSEDELRSPSLSPDDAEWTEDDLTSFVNEGESSALGDNVISDTQIEDSPLVQTDNAEVGAVSEVIPNEEWTEDDATPLVESSAPLMSAEEAASDGWGEDDIAASSDEPIPDRAVTTPAADDWTEDSLDWDDTPMAAADIRSGPPSTRDALAWLRPVQRSWKRLLAGMRNRLPAIAGLSDGLLSTLLVGVLLGLLIVLNGVRQPSKVVDVNINPDSASASEAIANAGTGAQGQPEDADLIAPDSELETAAPESTDSEPPLAPASPELVVTELDPAERDRIAAIQTQLMSGLVGDDSGLVETVQADFNQNLLTINLSNGWYRLSPYEQQALADTFKQSSTEMTFEQIQMRSPEGDLLARSPVVGDSMVILQTQKPPAVPVPPRPLFRITVDR